MSRNKAYRPILPKPPKVEPGATSKSIFDFKGLYPFNENPGAAGVNLSEARAWLKTQIDAGAICPCCTRFAKVYKRTITSAMAYALILIERHFAAGKPLEPGGWLHVPTFLSQAKAGVSGRGGDWAKLIYWGLLEKRIGIRGDKSYRVGHYKLLPLTAKFVHGKIRVPKFAYVYNRIAFQMSKDTLSMEEAVEETNRFNYAALMRR